MNKKNVLKTAVLSCVLLSSTFTMAGCDKEDDLKISLTAGDVTEVGPGCGHPPVPHQYPSRHRRHQGVLRVQPPVPVHGPDQPPG